MSISLFISSRFSNLLEYRFCSKEHIIFIKPLRISYIHTMYLYHIHFPLLLHSSQIYSHFPTIFCILFYKSLMNPVCAAHILKGRKSIYQRLCPLIKRTSFLKRHQLPIAPQLGLRSCEPLHTPRLHHVGLGWGLVSPSIRHALLCGIGVRSCESPPLYRQAQLLWVHEYSGVVTCRSHCFHLFLPDFCLNFQFH